MINLSLLTRSFYLNLQIRHRIQKILCHYNIKISRQTFLFGQHNIILVFIVYISRKIEPTATLPCSKNENKSRIIITTRAFKTSIHGVNFIGTPLHRCYIQESSFLYKNHVVGRPAHVKLKIDIFGNNPLMQDRYLASPLTWSFYFP